MKTMKKSWLEHIKSHVVAMNQVVSMNVPYDMCHGSSIVIREKMQLSNENTRLKAVIKERYGDSVLIIHSFIHSLVPKPIIRKY